LAEEKFDHGDLTNENDLSEEIIEIPMKTYNLMNMMILLISSLINALRNLNTKWGFDIKQRLLEKKLMPNLIIPSVGRNY
jgi:hypothetical protein